MKTQQSSKYDYINVLTALVLQDVHCTEFIQTAGKDGVSFEFVLTLYNRGNYNFL